MKQLEFKFAGICFLVDIDAIIGETVRDSSIESIIRVQMFDKKQNHYVPVHCDLDAFEHDLSDQIQQAFEDMFENERLAYEDMLYESAREDGLCQK